MDKFFIYTLEKNGIVFYVGLTMDMDKRLTQHKVKHGKDITMKCVDTYEGGPEAAFFLEGFWIKKLVDQGVALINHMRRDPNKQIISRKEITVFENGCRNCGTSIQQTPEKREKIFCSDTCRAGYNQKRKAVERRVKKTEENVNILPPKEFYDSPKLDLKNTEEPSKFKIIKRVQKQADEMPEIRMTFLEYKSQINQAGSAEKIAKIVSNSAKDSSLAEWQKRQIREHGIEVSRGLDF